MSRDVQGHQRSPPRCLYTILTLESPSGSFKSTRGVVSKIVSKPRSTAESVSWRASRGRTSGARQRFLATGEGPGGSRECPDGLYHGVLYCVVLSPYDTRCVAVITIIVTPFHCPLVFVRASTHLRGVTLEHAPGAEEGQRRPPGQWLVWGFG